MAGNLAQRFPARESGKPEWTHNAAEEWNVYIGLPALIIIILLILLLT